MSSSRLPQNPKFWRPDAKKVKIRKQLVTLVGTLLELQGVEKRGNVITLAGPNVLGSYQLFRPLLFRNMKSAENNRKVFKTQQAELAQNPKLSSKIELNFENWFSLAKKEVQAKGVHFLDADFCGTIEKNWNGMSDLHEIITQVNPTTKLMFLSVTHSCTRFPVLKDRESFFRIEIPRVWDSLGWRCSMNTYFKYQGGIKYPMYTSLYQFERR